MKPAYIVDVARTPIGKYGGTLAAVRPDDLAAHVIRKVLERNPSIDASQVEDVVFGAANQAGEDNRNVARMAALLAGLPPQVAGVTVNRLCASGLQAIIDATRAVMCGESNLYIAGGVESMSRAPYVMAKATEPFARNPALYDTTLGWRFTNPALAAMHHPYSMGETAENVASKYKISREAQDEFAFESQKKYAAAHEAHRFREELVPVLVPKGKDEFLLFETDEHPRLTTLQKLASLKPAFAENGTVTAGNSSGINDGAAAAIIASEEALKQYGLSPMARVVSVGITGVDPAYMGMGPVPAIQKALLRAGLTLADIGLVELNEAFASQVLACLRELHLDPSIVNVNGGSIALGHPLGCSGVRISGTLLHEMKKRGVRYGVASMCVGVGQGVAVVYESVRG